MTFALDRADMKLLTETGYSGLMRGIQADLTPIFTALDTWMPDFAAGPIGLALQDMVEGRFYEADVALTDIIKSKREGREEARAVLAMCKMLQKEQVEAEKLADELSGTGGYAEAFTHVMIHGVDEDSQEAQEPEEMAMEARVP